LKEHKTVATSEARIMSEFSNPNLDVLITAEEIQQRIRAMGEDIARDYAGQNPLMIGVLKGAWRF
jgi:hypoxanthine phosphoribosyltransferase